MLKFQCYLLTIFCCIFVYGNGFATTSSNLETILDLKHVCSDFEKIPLSSVEFPNDAIQYLNAIKERSSAKFYSSKSMISNWNKIKVLPVQGLNATVSDVFSFLHSQGCFVFPWGGSVRDLVMGHFIADIDAEITCDPRRLREACIEKFSAKNCQRHHRGNLKIIIGNFGGIKGDTPIVEPIDLAHWNETFGARKSALEFTANSLSFFPDSGLLIDISGKALSAKRYLYWTLRSKGFHPANEKIQRFIFSELQQNFNGNEAKHFLCHKFFDGKLEKNGLKNDCS
uniref:Poly A polymerase head domain-containing protein n=1 Tax=Panagrolaimus davidi TaxID=227884 RepID=A0A914QNV4_9BILA